MKRCPITYEIISDQENYSRRGLRRLSPQIKDLKPLEWDISELRKEAIARVGKMSIQGVQTKLSAQLSIKEQSFKIVDQHGHYILKPPSEYYPELPENEALTMSLAAMIEIEVPVHGLVYSKDNQWVYFIKRFDRSGHYTKIAIEDFSQLLQLTREKKYNSSMENVIKVVMKFCSFPKIEAVKLFRMTLFNFLIGNEDMHVKNFSLIVRDQKVMLSPAYDFLNTSIALSNPKEEIALPLDGKKRNLSKKDLLIYLPDKLALNELTVRGVLENIKAALPGWHSMIKDSFLSLAMQEKYLFLLDERCQRLGF